jgi:hypothetical protein
MELRALSLYLPVPGLRQAGNPQLRYMLTEEIVCRPAIHFILLIINNLQVIPTMLSFFLLTKISNRGILFEQLIKMFKFSKSG